MLRPLIWRPTGFQVAALCYGVAAAPLLVLLITSRDTGRWILPKGWPKCGFDASGTAAEEAWEEAGVKPKGGAPCKIGQYRYSKRLKGGVPVATDVDVYAIEVEKLYDAFPEVQVRRRRWMTPEEAARAVVEPGLKELLRTLPARLAI
jgi:8-oxo-dGTP pyrophosphatase MutT (NUDIX family)